MVGVSPFSPSGTYRRRSLSPNSSALVSETEPTSVQPVPVSNCQVPLPVKLVMAIPSGSPSTSVIGSTVVSLARISATVFPLLLRLSSVIPSSCSKPVLLNTGALLTAFTVIIAVSASVLIDVPAVAKSIESPTLPLDWSHAPKDRVATLSPIPGFGSNRISESKSSNRACEKLTESSSSHVVPSSIEYCQLPLPESVKETAMPAAGPSTSVTRPIPSLLRISATVLPGFPLEFCSTAVNVNMPEVSKMGASLTATTSTWEVTTVDLWPEASSATNSKSMLVSTRSSPRA